MREYSIKNYIKNCTQKELVNKINEMLNKYNKIYNNDNNKINIHDEFPKKKLVEIMKPYLLLYLTSCYSLIPIIKSNSAIDLKNKLRTFQKFNPLFGRRLVKMGLKLEANFKQKSYIKGYVFNDKHIAFNSNDNTKFLSNHLKYDEIHNNVEINNISSRLNYINRIILYTNLNRPMPTGNYIRREHINININNDDYDDNHSNSDSNSDSEDDTISQNNLSNHYDDIEDDDDGDSIS